MKIVLVLAASVSALGFSVSPSAGHVSVADACKPGRGTINKTKIYRYCGPAKAIVKVGGKRYPIAGGRCRKLRGTSYFAVDIGATTLERKPPVARFLTIRSPKLSDGVTRNASVGVELVGSSYTLGPVVVTIAGGRTRGTFVGDSLGPGGRVSGSWTC
jgi:hypothetical protein